MHRCRPDSTFPLSGDLQPQPDVDTEKDHAPLRTLIDLEARSGGPRPCPRCLARPALRALAVADGLARCRGRYVVAMTTSESAVRLARARARQLRCGAIRRDGKQCRSFASGSGAFCFAHDPARREAAQAARARGGHATRKPRFADVLRERMEAEIDRIIAAHVDALGSDDARIRLQAAEALLAAARGPRQVRSAPAGVAAQGVDDRGRDAGRTARDRPRHRVAGLRSSN